MCCSRSRITQIADELLQLLTTTSGEGSSSAAADRSRIDAVLDDLVALSNDQQQQQEFQEQLLRGGPWRVSVLLPWNPSSQMPAQTQLSLLPL